MTSLLFYAYFVGVKILIILVLSFMVFKFGPYILRKPKVLLWCVLIILAPMIIMKMSVVGSHFDKFSKEDYSGVPVFGLSNMFNILGLSYFSFNAISYLVDIKRKYIKPEKNYFLLLLYLVYFPAVFSGPLHRAKYLIEQFKQIDVTNRSISNGMRLILWGLFKSLVISQRLLKLIISLQDDHIQGIYYLVIGLLFVFFLYFNFSAFVDFFLGVSEIFNIRLKSNFGNRIYFASSRQKFWQGWHITLNAWFRDYFFFAIAKFDKKRIYTDVLLLITFVLIAMWHQFTASMFIWGGLSGIWIIAEKRVNLKKLPYPKLRSFLGVFYHLFFASIIALIFISSNVGSQINGLLFDKPMFSTNIKEYYVNILIIVFSFLIADYHNWKAGNKRFDDYMQMKPTHFRWAIYIKLVLMILVFGLHFGIDNYYIQF